MIFSLTDFIKFEISFAAMTKIFNLYFLFQLAYWNVSMVFGRKAEREGSQVGESLCVDSHPPDDRNYGSVVFLPTQTT